MSKFYKNIIKKLILDFRSLLKLFAIPIKYFLIKTLINRARFKNEKLKIIFGSGDISQKKWISTNKECLDLLNINTFNKLFKKNELDNVLAEHVFEHLTLNEGVLAIKNIKLFLKKGSKIRIAVPDGNFPDKEYINYVKPGGVGPGADDHKELYNFETIKKLFDSDFKIELLEYFDFKGNFHYIKWDINDGQIIRSKFYDPRNDNDQIKYTSVIVDAIYLG
jgi:predicted SAM-dependent methyltransferase